MPFKKFPNNKEEPANVILDNKEAFNKTSNLHQSSQNMLRVLQSINQSNVHILNESRPSSKIIRNKKTKIKINDMSNEMKSASKHKEKFNLSIKERKSHSEFQFISRNTMNDCKLHANN